MDPVLVLGLGKTGKKIVTYSVLVLVAKAEAIAFAVWVLSVIRMLSVCLITNIKTVRKED
jgi:hypothetical protein